MAARPVQMSHAHEVDLLLAHELLGPAAASNVASLPEPAGLHICPACERPFVEAGAVRELVNSDELSIELNCANCGWSQTAVYRDEELAELDTHADRAFGDLVWTLELVWIANEEAAIARFAAALDADAILPEDF